LKYSLSRTFLSISLNAISTASVLLAKPYAAITLSSKSSSMCIVIFMPYTVWHAEQSGKSNFRFGIIFADKPTPGTVKEPMPLHSR